MQLQKRILAYVTGLLYFYGVMPVGQLYLIVEQHFRSGFSEDEFTTLLERNALDDSSPYVFEMEDGVCFDLEVDDSEWVLAEQDKHPELSFYPLAEEDAACVVEDRYSQLFTHGEQKFFAWLEERCGQDSDLALTLLIEYASLVKNGMKPLELAKKLISEMEISGVEDVQEAAELIMLFSENTPRWTLKGWRESELAEA